MKLDEAIKKLKKAVVCERCHISGKECNDNCPIQYEAGTVGELVEALETVLDYCKVELKRENIFSYLDGVADGLKESQNDVIEELENIKTKIKVNAHSEYDFEGYCLEEKINIKEVNKIIDNRISELKGENNG